jgi:hypothetical protein
MYKPPPDWLPVRSRYYVQEMKEYDALLYPGCLIRKRYEKRSWMVVAGRASRVGVFGKDIMVHSLDIVAMDNGETRRISRYEHDWLVESCVENITLYNEYQADLWEMVG